MRRVAIPGVTRRAVKNDIKELVKDDVEHAFLTDACRGFSTARAACRLGRK
jgi:hypothetical protein